MGRREPQGPGQLPQARASTRRQTQVILLVQRPQLPSGLTYSLFDYLIFSRPASRRRKQAAGTLQRRPRSLPGALPVPSATPPFLGGQKLGTIHTSKGDQWLSTWPKVCTEETAEPLCSFPESRGPGPAKGKGTVN